jgi:hypothetical protein
MNVRGFMRDSDDSDVELLDGSEVDGEYLGSFDVQVI